MSTIARMRGKHLGIEKNGGNFVPLSYYEERWNKLVRRVESNHFVGKYRGYAIHKVLLDFMVGKFGRDVELVIIKRNTGEKFTSTLKDWQDKGIEINWQGKQICLPVNHMRSNNRKETAKPIDWEEERLAVVSRIKQEDKEQIGLFTRI